VSRGLLTESGDPCLECLDADLAGRHLALAQWAVGALRLASRLPDAVEALGAGRADRFRR
jgi:hypothetical protein